MPLTLKTTELQYKDSHNVYHGINAVAEKPTADVIADLDAAIEERQDTVEGILDAQETRGSQIAAAAQSAVDGIEGQKNTMIASIASVAGMGTDTTLTQSGVAADAKVTGDKIGDLKSAIHDVVADLFGCLTGDNVYQAERINTSGYGANYYGLNEKITIPKGSYAVLVSTLDLGFSLVSSHGGDMQIYRAWSKSPYLATATIECYAQIRAEDRSNLPDSGASSTFIIVVDDLKLIADGLRAITNTVTNISGIADIVKDDLIVFNYYVDAYSSIVNQIPNENTKMACFPCIANHTYTIQKTADTVFRVGYAKTNNIAPGTPLFGVIQNSDGSSITIQTGNDAQMMCIYYYNDTKSTLTETELFNSLSVVTPTAVDIECRNDVEKLKSSNPQTVEDLLKVFTIPSIPAQNGSDSSNQLVNLRNTSVSELYSVLQTIIDNSNGYITKTVCGLDSSETYEIWKLSLKNSEFADAPRKVLIDANVHCGVGDPIDPCFTMIWLCKFLSEEYRTNEVARYIRNNYDFEIIPLANPWGFANNSYGNANGVNINRNYDYNFVPNMSFNYNTTSGPSAFSEVETQYIRDMLLDNLDAYFWMDLHSYGDGVGKKAFYVQSGDSAHPYNAERARRIFAHTQNMIDGVEVEWYGNFDANGWGPAYGAKVIGVWSPNLECGNTLYGSADTYSSGALTSDFYDLIGFLMFS